MADDTLQLPPDSTGKHLDAESLTVGLNTVYRERHQIAGDSATDIAPVTAADGLLVNLGANNDVSLNAGTNNIGDVDVLTLPAIPAGTNNIGDVDIASLPDEGQQTMAASISVAIASDQTAVPVSGTVAVTGSATLLEQQTQTTHLAAIETAVELIDNAVSGSELQVDVVAPLPAGTNNIGDVDVLSSALPTGAATLAEQQAQTTHLATIAGDTTDIETAVELIDDTVATLGTSTYTEATTKGLVVGAVRRDADTTLVNTTNEVAPLQVDANGRLKVEAFSGETLPVSLAAGGTTQYAEDTAHVSGDLVTMAGVVQQTADAALSTDGDRSVLQVDASGFLKVNIKAGAGSGGTALADDAAFTPATTQGTPAFGYADETSPDLVDEGDAGALRMTLDRKLLTRIVGATDANRLDVDASGHAQVDIAAASVTVPVSAASLPLPSGAATEAKQDAEIVHLATIAGDTTAIETAVQIMDDWDETNRAAVNTIAGQVGVQGASGTVTALTQRVVLATDVALPAGTNNIGDVDVLTLPAIPAGNNNIGDVDIASAPTGTSSITVQGTAAHAAAAVGNPVYVAGRASTALPTDVGADGDAAAIWTNRNGLVVVSGIPGAGLNADPYTLLSVGAQYTTTQTSAVLLAGGASERIIVTSIQIQVGGTTAGTLQVYFGTGAFARGTNSAIFDGEFAPSATLKPGFVSSPPSGYRSPTLGHDVLVTTSAAINPLTITIWYYLLGV